MGSPASASSSTMEPWASCRMYLMGTLVRPSSTESCTGMSSTIWMSCIWAPPGPLWPPLGVAGALTASNAGAPSVVWALACSSRAWAQSSATSFSVDIGISQPVDFGSAQLVVDAQGVFAFVGAVLALEQGNPFHPGLDAGGALQFDEVAHLHGEQLLHRGVGLGQLGHQGQFGGLDLVAQQADPAAVHLDAASLHGGIQHVADWLQR